MSVPVQKKKRLQLVLASLLRHGAAQEGPLQKSREAAHCAPFSSLLDGRQQHMAKRMRQDDYHLLFGLMARRLSKDPLMWYFVAWNELVSNPCMYAVGRIHITSMAPANQVLDIRFSAPRAQEPQGFGP